MIAATESIIEEIIIRPQKRQEQFLANPADIAIFGGAAGGGKSWSLLVEPLRHIHNPRFGAVIFRRTFSEITREGGLWDEADAIYPLFNSDPNKNDLKHAFPSGANISFAHMQYEKDKYSWKSAQIALIEFDQLETFTRGQFFYMLSRNRSLSGVRPYIRASVNPEPGWVADFLDWWIGEDGYAIPERSGKIRWMVQTSGDNIIHWGDTYDELFQEFKIHDLPDSHPKQPHPKSVTFVLSTIFDNQILLERDPGYLANLQALDYVERERLLGDVKRGGNWKIKPSAGKIFNRSWFEIVDAVPAGGRVVRFYDFAATEKELTTKKKSNDPDYTASVKGKIVDGITYFLDMTNERMSPARTDTTIRNIADQDQMTGIRVAIRFEREGGASGKRDAYNLITKMQGFDIQGIPSIGDKVVRAKPLAAQALAGNVKLLRGEWNEEFLAQYHGFPDLPHDDIVDAGSGCYNELVGRGGWARSGR